MGNLSSKKDLQGLNMEGFWRHSLCVGVAAKILAKQRGIDIKQQEEYFTAGLLHDIGKIPLNAVLSKEYMLTVSAADRERISLFRAEEKILGLNHNAAGAMIVKAWRLEGAVGEAVIHHHNYMEYSGAHQDVLFSIAAANRFASIMEIGFSGDRYPEKTDNLVWETLGVTRDAFDEIEGTVNKEIEKAKIFLRL
jgi:putative nucleotidyltransferase with HDIG domain